MTISSELTALQQDITNARTAVTNKGGQVTSGGGSSQLATDIATIPTGITPSGNKAITATTTTQTGIDVTNYATASVEPTPSESKTLTLGSSAPSTVTPTSGKYLSSIPVSIDSTVIKAENIAQGTTILGIAGTHSGGGGSLKPLPIITENGTYIVDTTIGAVYDGTYYTQTDVNTTSIDKYAFLYEITFKTGDDINSEQWLFGISCTTANEHLGLRIYNGRLYCHSNYDQSSLISTPIEANTTYNVIYDRNRELQTTYREWVVNGTRIATILNRYRGYTANTYLWVAGNPQITGNYFKGTINEFELWISADGDYSRDNTKFRAGFDNYYLVNEITDNKFLLEDIETESSGYDGFESPIEVAVPLTKYGLSIDDMLGDVNASGVYQVPRDVTTPIVFSGIKSITSTNSMQYYFYSRRNLKCSVSFPDLTAIQTTGLQYAFYYTPITSFTIPTTLNLSSSTSAFNFTFYQCTNLVSANFTVTNLGSNCLYNTFYGCTSLTTPPTITATATASSCMAYCFYNCTALTSFTFPELLTAGHSSAFSYCFYGCTHLTNVTFTKMTRISTTGVFTYAFSGCKGGLNVYFTALTTLSSGQTFSNTWRQANNAHVYFPALTNDGIGTSKTHFSTACASAASVTLHFPASVQAKIEALTNYPNFGGTNTIVLFDL